METNVDFNGGVKEDRTYNITNSSVYTINGAIINSSYAITKSGDGTLVFGIDNSSGWSNTLTINSGTVAAGDDDAFGTGTVTLNGGSISSNNTSARSLSNTIQLQNSSSLGNSTNNGTLTLSGGITFLDKNLTLTSNSNNTISSIDFGTDPQTISVASGVTSTISGNIGNGNFTKTGSGTMTIAGNYTNNSPFTISAGQVEVTGTLFGGNFSNSISNSGQLNINTTSNQTLAGKISGSGEINKNNSGILTISSSTNDYTGRTIIEGGTISISSSSNLGITPGSVDNDNITLNNGTLQTTSSFTLGSNKGIMTTGSGGTINTNASTTLSYGGVINGSGSISKTGSGTLSLSGSNTYTGNTTISAGTLTNTGTLSDSTAVSVSSGATFDVDATDTVASIEGAGAIDIAGSQTLTAGDSNNKTFSGVISGAGGFTKAGSGTLVLSGTNTYTGNTTISAGTLAIQGQLESGNYDGTISNSGTLNVNSSSNQTLAGVISGTGSLTKEGSGTLTLSGSNTYSGSTTITAGTISASSSANLGATPGAADGDNIIFNGGTLNTTADFTLGSNKGITMTGNGTINVNSSTTLTFDGIITDSGNLTKSGAGTLVLGGSNQNDGAISINAGILEISNQYSLGTDTDGTTVANGATLKITDAVTIANEALILNGTGVSNAGALQTTHSSGTVLLTGSTTLGSDTTINVGNGNLRFDQAIASGSDSYDVTFTGNGGEIRTAGGININSGSVTMSASGTLFSETANSYSGGTTISSGSLLYGANDAFGTGAITMTGGKFYTTDATAYNINENLNIQGSIILGNTGASNSTTFSGTNTLTGNASATIQSSVSMAAIDDGSNSYNFSKLGSGTLTLTGSNGYDGTTTISAGTLTVTGTLDDNTAVTVSSGATYDVDASDTISSLAGAGTIDIASSQTLTVGNSSDQEISGTITGSGAFNKNGTGKLTLSGTGNDVGSIIISNGTIEVSGLLNSGSYSGNITNRSAIIFSSSSNQTISGNIIREGTLTKNGSGILTLSGTNNYAGATTINSGTLTVSGTLSDSTAVTVASGAVYDVDTSDTIASVGGAGNIEIASSQTLTAGDSNNKTLSGVISGSGGFTKAGSGTQTLSGTNTYTGATTINAGTLTVTGTLSDSTAVTVASGAVYDVDASDTIASVGGAGNIEIASSQTLTAGDSNNKTLSGVISGSGGFTKAGSGTQTLSGTNTYSGATTINAGTLTVSGTLSDSTAVTVASGAVYDVDASDTITSLDGAGTIEIASSVTLTTGDTNDQELSGTISGSGSLTKAGSGILTLSGTNSYSGNTTISAGTLLVRSQLGEGTYAGNISNSGDFGINSSSDQTLSGVISGSGTINKSGTGELTLTGANTFNGTINVAGGTLFAGTSSDSSNNITQGNIVVKGGTLGGGGVIGGDVSFTTTGGTLAPGNSIGTLTVSGDLTLSADDTTEIEFDASNTDKIIVNGDISLDGTLVLEPASGTYSAGVYTIIDGNSGSGNTLSGTFASTTVNNSSNISGFTTSISYDTSLRRVFLTLSAAASVDTVKSKTTMSSFKDIAEIFDTNTGSKFASIKTYLTNSGTNSTTVNKELEKLKGTVFTTSYAQPALNHGHFNRALNNVTSTNMSTSLVSNFANTTDELTLASLQEAGLYGKKENFNEYFDFSDQSVLGFIKNNKNKSLLNDFKSEDSATFIRTYGTTANRDNIGTSYTGYKSETTGILFGQQFKNDDEKFTGYSYGFTGTDTDYKNNYGESKTYSMHASLFRQIDKEDYGINLISGMYVSKTESERNVVISGASINDKYLSDYWDIGFNQEAQYIKKFEFAGLNLAPSAKINSTYVIKGDTEEEGGELALTIENDNLFIVKPEIGLSIGKDISKKDEIANEFNIAMFASKDHFLEGTTSKARYTSGSSFNVDMPRDEEIYYSLGLGYNFLNNETDTSLMANAFLMQNEYGDMDSNIFSLTFRKLFGEFGKGNIPPVVAKKSENKEEDILVIDLPTNKKEEIIKEGEKSLEKLEKNIEIVLKEDPTQEEVETIYQSLSDSLIAKRKLTVNDVYKNLSANCNAVEKNLKQLVNYYNKLQLYRILDRCNKLSDPKVHLIAERLHQIQLDERTALTELYYGYLRFLNYIPMITFIAFIILAYEFIRRYIVNHFKRRLSI